jgi:uncharacterized protein
MSNTTLENFVAQYIAATATPEIWFNWHGGEITLAGRRFFEKAVKFQEKYAPQGKQVRNVVQTNGVLVDDEWERFFHDHGFLVGVSLDGPPDLHDGWRVDHAGRPTAVKVLAAIERLQRHGVAFNLLAVVHRDNAAEPLRTYRFLRDLGAEFMQFIPLVERSADGETLAPPPQLDEAGVDYRVTEWSVTPAAYGDFLCEVFDEWHAHDVGRVIVQLFEVQLGLWAGLPSSLCVFAPTCGQGLVHEWNGDIYSCDHYVYPEYRLGNIETTPLAQMARGDAQRAFGTAKRASLTRQCRDCEFLFACNGGCPKHRFQNSEDGEPGLDYFCEAHRHFFQHAGPRFRQAAMWMQTGLPI